MWDETEPNGTEVRLLLTQEPRALPHLSQLSRRQTNRPGFQEGRSGAGCTDEKFEEVQAVSHHPGCS